METWNLLLWENLFLCSMETLKFYYDEKFYYDYVVWKFYAKFYYAVIIVVTIIGE